MGNRECELKCPITDKVGKLKNQNGERPLTFWGNFLHLGIGHAGETFLQVMLFPENVSLALFTLLKFETPSFL